MEPRLKDISKVVAALEQPSTSKFIRIPPGVYRGSLMIQRSVTLVATDPTDTIIEAPPGQSCVSVEGDGVLAVLHGFRFRGDLAAAAVSVKEGSCELLDCTVEAGEGGTAVSADGPSAILILRRSSAAGGRTAISVRAGARCTLLEGTVAGPSSAYAGLVESAVFQVGGDCTVLLAGHGGIALQGAARGDFVRCTVKRAMGSTSDQGFALPGLIDARDGPVITLVDCFVEDGLGCGINLHAAKAVLMACAVTGHSSHGVAAADGSQIDVVPYDLVDYPHLADWVVEGCPTFNAHSNGGDGIHLESGSILVASQPAMRGNGGAGVHARGSEAKLNGATIFGNLIAARLGEGATIAFEECDLTGNSEGPIISAEGCHVKLNHTILYEED